MLRCGCVRFHCSLTANELGLLSQWPFLRFHRASAAASEALVVTSVPASIPRRCSAEAAVLSCPGPRGDGLPICCISGLGVAEAAQGAGAGPPEEAAVSQLFWEQLLGFYKVAQRRSETVMGNRRADSKNLHSYPEISQKSL